MAALSIAHLACSPPTAPESLRPPAGKFQQSLQPEIRGLVREIGGGPVAGATVEASYPPRTTVITDADGRFTLPSTAAHSPVHLAARVGHWGVRYFWDAGATVPLSSDPSPVSVELKLQPAQALTESHPLTMQLTDDALSFRYPGAFSCGPCYAVMLRPAHPGDFDVRVEASAPGSLRILLVGSENLDDVLFAEASSQLDTDAVLRVTRAHLARTQYDPVVYIERPRGQPPLSLRVTLDRVR